MASPMTTRPLTRFDDATASNANVDLMMAVVLGGAAAWVVSALGTPLVFDPTDRDSQNWTLTVGATVDDTPFEALFGLRVYAGSREEDEYDDPS
jgi:hypothetical protein